MKICLAPLYNFLEQSVVVLSALVLSVIMLSLIMTSVIMLSVVMQSAVMLIVSRHFTAHSFSKIRLFEPHDTLNLIIL
jgi:hypothetical protein